MALRSYSASKLGTLMAANNSGNYIQIGMTGSTYTSGVGSNKAFFRAYDGASGSPLYVTDGGMNLTKLYAGSMAIGGTTAKYGTPPSGGAIIQGNVGIGTTSPGAKLAIDTGATTNIGLIVQGVASQSGDFFEILNSVGGVITSCASTGLWTFNFPGTQSPVIYYTSPGGYAGIALADNGADKGVIQTGSNFIIMSYAGECGFRQWAGGYCNIGQGTAQTYARLIVDGIADNKRVAVLRQYSGQSVNTFEVLDSNNNFLLGIGSTGRDFVLDTTTGTKIGTSTTQKIGFWNTTPIVQPTTAVAEAAFVENAGGTVVNVDSTFGGYTLQQIVQALRNLGLLS